MKKRFVGGAILAGVVGGLVAARLLGGASDHSRIDSPTRENVQAHLEEAQRQRQERGRLGSRPVERSPEGLVVNATDANYDPVDLAHTYELDLPELFAAEPRVEPFASMRERRLQSSIAEDILPRFPGADVASVECHASSCQVTVNVAADQLHDVYRGVQRPKLGELIQPVHLAGDEPGVSTIVLTVLFSKEHRDPAAYSRWYESVRSWELRIASEQGGSLPGER